MAPRHSEYEQATRRKLGTAGWIALSAVVAVFLVVWAPRILAGRRGPVAMSPMCLLKVKQDSLAFLMYANDYDDRLPKADQWMDSLYPYTRNEVVFHCTYLPEPRTDAYGYAMRKRLSTAKTSKVKEPEKEAMVFDSDLLVRNAFTDQVFDHGFTRHPHQNVGYLDGHARAIYPQGHPE